MKVVKAKARAVRAAVTSQAPIAGPFDFTKLALPVLAEMWMNAEESDQTLALEAKNMKPGEDYDFKVVQAQNQRGSAVNCTCHLRLNSDKAKSWWGAEGEAHKFNVIVSFDTDKMHFKAESAGNAKPMSQNEIIETWGHESASIQRANDEDDEDDGATDQQCAHALKTLIEDAGEDYGLSDPQTYADAGKMTRNAGLVVKCNGREFDLTVV